MRVYEVHRLDPLLHSGSVRNYAHAQLMHFLHNFHDLCIVIRTLATKTKKIRQQNPAKKSRRLFSYFITKSTKFIPSLETRFSGHL